MSCFTYSNKVLETLWERQLSDTRNRDAAIIPRKKAGNQRSRSHTVSSHLFKIKRLNLDFIRFREM